MIRPLLSTLSVLLLACGVSAQATYDARILDYVGLKYPCNGEVTPVLKIINNGSASMNGCVVETWKNGLMVASFNWQLAVPAVTGEVRRPALPLVIVGSGDVLEFHIISVNTIPDEVAEGNILSKEMNDVPAATPGNTVTVELETDNDPTDLTWEIRSALNVLIAAGGPYEDANALITQEVALGANACFTFLANDASRGGASTARFKVKGNGNTLITAEGSDLAGGYSKGLKSGSGTVCTEQLAMVVKTDGAPEQTRWELTDQGSGAVVCVSSGAYPTNGTIMETCCVPEGCYRLMVSDLGGDGIVAGGYQLRLPDGRRIIDNSNNFSTGSVSQISGTAGGTFCLPMGVDLPIWSSCDRLDWTNYKFFVAHANVAVTDEYANTATRSTTGYEFWFYDPNGGYSYRRFRSHSTSDGYGSGATRACHFKINRYSSIFPDEIPQNVLLNVRVRARVAGNNLTFGPACLFKIDPALAACPHVQLQDNPALHEFSCAVFRNWGGSNSAANRVTAGAPQPIPVPASNAVRYQFRFRLPAENVCIVRPPQASPRIFLNWTTGTPLECNKPYQVDVRVSVDGGASWCFGAAVPDCNEPVTPWGKVCVVTTNPCPAVAGGSSSTASQGNGTFTMYPNPNRGDRLFINLGSANSDAEKVTLTIYDLSGKRIMERSIPFIDGILNSTIELPRSTEGGELAPGMYLVSAVVGGTQYTQRLVIHR